MSRLKPNYKLQSAFPSLDSSLQDDNLLASQRRRLLLARKTATGPVCITDLVSCVSGLYRKVTYTLIRQIVILHIITGCMNRSQTIDFQPQK